MVILSTSKYTMHTRTPILNAKLGKHYARLMHLSLIWLSPLIFVPEHDIEGNRDIWVDVQMPPVLPLCEFF